MKTADFNFDDHFSYYRVACYLVYLERGDDLTSPPRPGGEDMVIGEHIRFIRLFHDACRLAGRSIPPFDVQGTEFPGMEVAA